LNAEDYLPLSNRSAFFAQWLSKQSFVLGASSHSHSEGAPAKEESVFPSSRNQILQSLRSNQDYASLFKSPHFETLTWPRSVAVAVALLWKSFAICVRQRSESRLTLNRRLNRTTHHHRARAKSLHWTDAFRVLGVQGIETPLVYGRLPICLKMRTAMVAIAAIPPKKAKVHTIQKTFRPARPVIGLLHAGQYLLIVSCGFTTGRTSLLHVGQKTMFSRPTSL
jgi:hypothetical protein